MKTTKPIFAIWIFASVTLFSGCLEHTYHITAFPDKSIGIDYQLKGDQADLDDSLELHPDSLLWSIERNIEETEDQTNYILSGSLKLKRFDDLGRSLDWSKSVGDSIFLKPIVEMTSRWVPLGKIWRFQGVLDSRQFIERYGDIWDYVPEECRILEDDEDIKGLTSAEQKLLELKFGLGVIQWNRARYERAFDRTWSICETRNLLLPDDNLTGHSVARAGWIDDLHIYLNSLDVAEPQTANLNWWSDLRNDFLDRIGNLIPVEMLPQAGLIADAIEQEYQISKGLEDDNFVFELNLPGIVFKENGLMENQVIHWEFQGKEISNQTQIMTASAFIIDYVQIVILLLLAIGLLVYSMVRKKDRSEDLTN